MIRVESIMSMNVVSISHTSTVGVAEMCLAEARLTGAPMVDETGKLLGVISVTDILQYHAAGLDPDSDTVASIGTAGAITIMEGGIRGNVIRRKRDADCCVTALFISH